MTRLVVLVAINAFASVGVLAQGLDHSVESREHQEQQQAEIAQRIERDLGSMVASGTLTLEQAQVMLQAYRHHQANTHADRELHERLEQAGVSPPVIGRMLDALMREGIEPERHRQVMQVIMRLRGVLDDSSADNPVPENIQSHLINRLGLTQSQSNRVVELARQLQHDAGTHSHPDEGNPTHDQPDTKAAETLMQSAHQAGQRLLGAVETGEISQDAAWKAWKKFKSEEFFPELEHAVESKAITRQQFEEIRTRIEEGEAQYR